MSQRRRRRCPPQRMHSLSKQKKKVWESSCSCSPLKEKNVISCMYGYVREMQRMQSQHFSGERENFL